MRRVCMAMVMVLAFASIAHAEEELPNAVPTVLYKRWALSMAYGPDFARARTEEASVHPLLFFELALRYRIIRPLELGASIGGGLTPSLGYLAFYADVRYRALAEAAWNPYVLGGIGIAQIDYNAPSHLIMRAGLGLERRFNSWAFASDVQLARAAGDGEPMPFYLDDAKELEHYGIVSVSVTLAATYYWGSGAPPLRRHGVP